ncbi:Bax inhibitor-1/YccA family protein [Cystobacter fuscus]|uniref:Membrane protein n=1 Tax=Cystobacter fuscus (strain ATCC 25194 / DSM 2262 / NBRC 100088 / M29) TaxID=1242864 RepID=S9NWU6_CYSF2|nr:membrane protein [Cystobacter fuscus DSM 2262]WNG18907.1 Bax inhibitor-1/YccA family protein [Cystobacter fuscus]
MAWETQGWQPARADVTDVLMQESQRTFMSRVYGWMFAGLLTTGVVALLAASSQQAVMMVAQFRWVFLIAQLGLVFALSGLAPRMSAPVAGALFLVYSVLTGLTFSVLFYVYTGGSIANAFLMSAGTFGAMSVYGAVTKKDLSGWGTFLFMGLIGVVIASVVQIFVQNSMLNFVLGCAGVVLFAGLAAYDTQKLREMHAAVGYKSATSASINGALVLYLDFINLFISLLRLFGDRRDD